MKITIDRIEGEVAVIELPNQTTIGVPLILFENATEGAVYRIEADEVETAARHNRMRLKLDRLFQKE